MKDTATDLAFTCLLLAQRNCWQLSAPSSEQDCSTAGAWTPALLAEGEEVQGGLAASGSSVYWGSSGTDGWIRQIRTDLEDAVASEFQTNSGLQIARVDELVMSESRLFWLGMRLSGYPGIGTTETLLASDLYVVSEYHGLSVRGNALSWSSDEDVPGSGKFAVLRRTEGEPRTLVAARHVLDDRGHVVACHRHDKVGKP